MRRWCSTANPNAPTGAPKLKTVILKNVADAAARRLLIEQGDADIARDLGADQIASLAGKPGLVVKAVPSAQQDYIILNSANKDKPALGNPALWKALRYLVDYDGIANKLLKGQYIVHQTFLPEGFPGALTDISVHARSGQGEEHPGRSRPEGRLVQAHRLQPAALHRHRPVAAGELRRGRRKARDRAGGGERTLRQAAARATTRPRRSTGSPTISTPTPTPPPSPSARATTARTRSPGAPAGTSPS